jgi:GNAT superfamily N-acetyltransferase
MRSYVSDLSASACVGDLVELLKYVLAQLDIDLGDSSCCGGPPMLEVEISRGTKADFDEIVTNINDFWGSDRTLHLHHPMYVSEFADSSYVIKEKGKVVAYLFGFISQTGPVGYVSLVGVRESHQRPGLGQMLYGLFSEYARAKGCTGLKAVTAPSNTNSIDFHTIKIGMELDGEMNNDGIRVVKDYAGPGKDRVVFRKKL